jgi:hypothetical protein
MRLQLAAPLVALAVIVTGSGRASAQVVIGGESPVAWSSTISPGPPSPFVGSAMAGAVPSFPYSYYAAFPDRARQYVPYGAMDQFPYFGSPYGLPNDRWSWSTLAGTSGAPRRYFYPPVR